MNTGQKERRQTAILIWNITLQRQKDERGIVVEYFLQGSETAHGFCQNGDEFRQENMIAFALSCCRRKFL